MTVHEFSGQRSIRIKGDNYEYNFSRGILAHTLIDMGIDYEVSYELALKIQDRIFQNYLQDVIIISETEYTQFIESATDELLPPEQAEKVKLILDWKERGKPIVILLAGIEGTGGTTIAKSLADRFSISQLVSTKYVSNILRKIIAPELAPELHSKTYKAHEHLRPIDSVLSDDVLLGFIENARFVTVAIEALIRRALTEGISLIIRGEHILPRYLSDDILRSPNVIYSAVTLSSRREHLRRLIRSKDRRNEEEIILNYNSIRKINDYLLDVSEQMNLMVIDNKGGIEESLKMITDMVLDRIPQLL